MALGYTDLEEVKRYTGFGTGPCQGKECLRMVVMAVAAASGRSRREIAPFTRARPGPHGAARASPARSRATRGNDRTTREIAIIGAGIMGLAIAYNLAAKGGRRVVVVDGSYLAWGASGRNGGGVRQQWSTEMNVRLMQESMEICAHFAQEMRINVWMRRGGYLFLARTAAVAETLAHNVEMQNRCGVETRMIAPAEAQAIVPELDVGRGGGFAAACYNPTDGIVFPWPFLWGYARGAQKRGVEIHNRTPVTAIERDARGFRLRDLERRLPRRAGGVRRGRLVAGGRASRRRDAPEPSRPSRDPLDRAAEAVLEADGFGARKRPLRLAVAARRAGGRDARCPMSTTAPFTWARGSRS